MKLSEYNIKPQWNKLKKIYEEENIDRKIIEEIVYSGICDTQETAEYGILFGSSRIIEAVARVSKTMELYQTGRIKKIIISGSNNGISSIRNNQSPLDMDVKSIEFDSKYDDAYSESFRMKLILEQQEVKSDDIIIDTESNNTIESLKRLKSIIGFQSNIILITSSYHLKRCLACGLKYYSKDSNYILVGAYTGIFEEENYYANDLGRKIIYFEAMHLISQARQGIIEDIDTTKDKKTCKSLSYEDVKYIKR